MELNELMAAFGAEIGIADLAADGGGSYNISFDEMIVSLSEDREAGRLVIQGEVGEPPEGGREHFYRLLLEMGFRGALTGGAAFVMQPDAETVWLQRVDALATLDFEGFKSVLETFVALLENMRRTVADLGSAAAAIAAGRPSADKTDVSGFMKI